MGTTADKLSAIIASKAAIKSAIEAKGVSDVGDVLSAYPSKIAEIPTGASAGWMAWVPASNLSAWLDGVHITNTITDYQGEATLSVAPRAGWELYCEIIRADGTTYIFPRVGGATTVSGPVGTIYA